MESADTLAARYQSRNRSLAIGRCVSRGIDIVNGSLGLKTEATSVAG